MARLRRQPHHAYAGRERPLPARLARFLPEDGIPEPNASLGEMLGLHPNLSALVEKTNETMRHLAAEGRVILVGRGANFATAGMPHGIHVRLVASREHRARYLAHRYAITFTEALSHNDRCDAARRRYVRRTFQADVTDPTAYDLVLNTSQMSLREAAELIWSHVQSRLAHSRSSVASRAFAAGTATLKVPA